MADPIVTAAPVLAARWLPDGKPGALGCIRADLGAGQEPLIITVDQLRLMSDEETAILVEALCDLHNATLWVPAGADGPMTAVLDEVAEERRRQVAAGWSRKHDDQHTAAELENHIYGRLLKAASARTAAEHRRRLIQVAALAVAAVERWDRQQTATKPQGEAAHG